MTAIEQYIRKNFERGNSQDKASILLSLSVLPLCSVELFDWVAVECMADLDTMGFEELHNLVVGMG